MELEIEIGKLLNQEKQTLATAESATGGFISHLITSVPGSSDYFKGGVVAYSNEAKVRILSVDEKIIQNKGAVSREVAISMAEGAKRVLNSDIGISDTGIAGPSGGTGDKPVGLFYVGICGGRDFSYARRFVFKGQRKENKQSAAQACLRLLEDYLKHIEQREVVTSFIECEGKVALLRRSAKVGTYQGKWAVVSGYLEEGRTPFEQALLEMEEEVGLKVEEVELVKEGEEVEALDRELHRRWIIHPFHFKVRPRELAIDWEHTELRWVLPSEIAQYETVPQLWEAWKKVE
jgi:PncC family amidohydrolase